MTDELRNHIKIDEAFLRGLNHGWRLGSHGHTVRFEEINRTVSGQIAEAKSELKALDAPRTIDTAGASQDR